MAGEMNGSAWRQWRALVDPRVPHYKPPWRLPRHTIINMAIDDDIAARTLSIDFFRIHFLTHSLAAPCYFWSPSVQEGGLDKQSAAGDADASVSVPESQDKALGRLT